MSEEINYVTTVPDHHDRIVWRNNYYHLETLAAKQAEIDELRKQVAMLRDFAGKVIDYPFENRRFELIELARKLIVLTGSIWFDEQIAAAKAEQREKDADICEDHEDYSIRFCAQLIHNQKD